MPSPKLTLLTLIPASALAAAQPGDATLARLGAESFEAREQSEQELSESDAAAMDELLALLGERSLSAEAHRRIARVAFRRFADTPRAGMGVSFDLDRAIEKGVAIREPVANFPAFELIKPGDVILIADGIELRNSEQLGSIIVSHDPGDVIEITLEREGERLTIDVPLGSFAALGQRPRVEPARLEGAFAQRCARAGAAGRAVSDTLGDGLTIDDWAAAELGLGDGIHPHATPPEWRPRSNADVFVRGGRPRALDAVSAPRDPRAGVSATMTMANRNAMLLAKRLSELARERVLLRVRLQAGDEPEAALEKLRLAIEDLDARIEEMTTQLGAGGR